jgi:hypothetical protein
MAITCCKTSMAVEVDVDVGPLGALPVDPIVSTTEVEKDIDGRTLGGGGGLPAGPVTSTTKVEENVNGGPPWGALLVGLAAATTGVEDDVDGVPPRGCCRRVRQCPPQRLKKTLMVGTLGALSAGPTAFTTDVEDDVNCAPLGGATGGSGNVHHRG